MPQRSFKDEEPELKAQLIETYHNLLMQLRKDYKATDLVISRVLGCSKGKVQFSSDAFKHYSNAILQEKIAMLQGIDKVELSEAAEEHQRRKAERKEQCRIHISKKYNGHGKKYKNSDMPDLTGRKHVLFWRENGEICKKEWFD
jgi:hypothetical protein